MVGNLLVRRRIGLSFSECWNIAERIKICNDHTGDLFVTWGRLGVKLVWIHEPHIDTTAAGKLSDSWAA